MKATWNVEEGIALWRDPREHVSVVGKASNMKKKETVQMMFGSESCQLSS